MSVSWPSARITVSAASVSNRPVGCGKPDSSSSITSTCISGALERRDRAQPVDPHALPLGVLRLLLVRRHLLAGAAVDDQRLLRAQPPRHPRGVHRRVAAAVDRDAPPDHGPLARRHVAQERHRVHDRARVPRRDVHALGQVRADRDEHRVEAALPPLGLEVGRRGDCWSSARPAPRSARPPRSARRAACGRRGCRSASSRPAPARHRGSRPRARAAPGGRRPRARSARAPITSTRLPLRTGGGVEQPSALERQVAEEALDRVDRHGAVEVRAVAVALARVVADAPVDGGERIVRHQRSATPARARRPARAPASPGCSRPPGRRCCTAAADRRTPGAPRAPDPTRERPCSRSGSGVISLDGPLTPAGPGPAAL